MNENSKFCLVVPTFLNNKDHKDLFKIIKFTKSYLGVGLVSRLSQLLEYLPPDFPFAPFVFFITGV